MLNDLAEQSFDMTNCEIIFVRPVLALCIQLSCWQLCLAIKVRAHAHGRLHMSDVMALLNRPYCSSEWGILRTNGGTCTRLVKHSAVLF
jgi:hypothetical protein